MGKYNISLYQLRHIYEDKLSKIKELNSWKELGEQFMRNESFYYHINNIYFQLYQNQWESLVINKCKKVSEIWDECDKFIKHFNTLRIKDYTKKELKAMQKRVVKDRITLKQEEEKIDKYYDFLMAGKDYFDIDIDKIDQSDLDRVKNKLHKELPMDIMKSKCREKCEKKLESGKTFYEKIINFCIVYGNLAYSHQDYKNYCYKQSCISCDKYNGDSSDHVDFYFGIDLLF